MLGVTEIDFRVLLNIFITAFTLLFTVIIFLAGRRLRSNVVFAAFVFATGSWALAIAMIYFTTDSQALSLWVRDVYFSGGVIPALFLYFALVFPEEKQPRQAVTVGLIALQYILFFMYYFTDSILHGVEAIGAERFIHYGSFRFMFDIPFITLFFTGFYITWIKYRQSQGELRNQFRFIIIGTLLGLIIAGIPNVILPWFSYFKLMWFGPIGLLVWFIFLGYGVARHHLFSVKVIATELLTFSIWIIFIGRIFLAPSFRESMLDIGVLFALVVAGIFLIRSVFKEVKQKEQLALLNIQLDKTNADLKDLNDHLNQKVAEQTVEIRKSYEVEKIARLELEELDKAKDQFILTTQHHLRTPLTIVKGYISSLLDKPPETTLAESKDVLNKTSVAADRLASLVNEFLDISQMEVGKSVLNKLPTNIKDLITDITKELEPEIQKKNISLAIKAENDIVLNIDPFKMKEALTNIIDNAVKYNKTGGSISVKGEKTTHPIERDKQIYRLSIEDTGIGITKEELSKLFTQYFQRGKEAEKIYTTGRGLGLAIAKNIIQAHQGRIYAESDGRDKGARFVVEMGA